MNLNIKFIKSSINLHSNKIQNNVSMQSKKKLLVLTKISSKSRNAHEEFLVRKTHLKSFIFTWLKEFMILIYLH